MSPGPLDEAGLIALMQAYLDADYCWERAGRRFALRIGSSVADLEAAFPAAREFGLLSAWNPHSLQCPEASNHSADAALHSALHDSGIDVRRGFSRAPDGSWCEHGWVTAGLAGTGLDALCRRFGQLGSLYCRRGEPLRLRIYHARPKTAIATDYIDWLPAAES